MQSKLLDINVLCTVQENRGLLALNGTVASLEQHRDLVSFREIGIQYSEAYIHLRDPSGMVPQRKRRLQTFSALKRRPSKVKLKEREQKLISRCLRKRFVVP